ncbi:MULTISPECIES: hypothetical protein [Natrialbaceae]|uniref:hypothetical protein n=1 Tax=Natrialbaceae TaxID=1644061 RepID=UPI00207C87AD|nr:hypothetical protein [Natronococcus sp. CG52]
MTRIPTDEMGFRTMPRYLQDEFDTYVIEDDETGSTGYAYLGLEGGKWTGARRLEGPEEAEYGFLLFATAETGKSLPEGELEIIDGPTDGDFELDGDMQTILRCSDSAVRLTAPSSSIDAEFAGEWPEIIEAE